MNFIYFDQFSADGIGRKKTVIALVGINMTGILIEGFSVCWEMMITCLFVVGFALGGKSRNNLRSNSKRVVLREKCPNTEFFLVRNFLYLD